MVSMGDHARDLLLGQTVTQVFVELGSRSVCVKILIFTHSAQLKHSVMFIILKANKNIKAGKFYFTSIYDA